MIYETTHWPSFTSYLTHSIKSLYTNQIPFLLNYVCTFDNISLNHSFFIYIYMYIYLPRCNSSMFTKYNISISSHFTLRKLHRFVVGVHKHEWSLSIHSHLVQEQHLRDANSWGHLGTGADLRRALHHQAVGLLYYVWSLYDLTCPWCNGCCLWDTREVL